jgi:hypothetical protein
MIALLVIDLLMIFSALPVRNYWYCAVICFFLKRGRVAAIH